ncbi:uncharacterized protein LOC135845406 isoform X4 [Planococcus citri]|uniref:uncharacterized protein LOC135845406 isoform X4 n=1 Tax=Planococcus citri TaxID=170843 RepID=UPI0031F9D966
MMAAKDIAVTDNKSHSIPCNRPGHLQELACVIASASIWYHKVKECRQESNIGNILLAFDGVHLSDIAGLPTVLRKMIDRRIKVVEYLINEWCYYHEAGFFWHREEDKDFFVDSVLFISWHNDGTINRKQTAKNLVESSLLSEVEKYEIACVYCLVDDVKKRWPTTTHLKHPLIEYWDCRMSGEQDSMDADPECSCVEASLLKKSAADTWPAFEYLWGFLTDDEQVQKVVGMSNSKDGAFLKHTLCMLNEDQLRRVMMSRTVFVFRSLFHETVAWVICIWNRVENMITVDEFFAIIRVALSEFRERGPLLIFEIWIRASDTLKNHVLVNHSEKVLEMFCSYSDYYGYDVDYFRNGRCKDVRLLIEMLSVRNAESREKIWREKWLLIIIGVSPEDLQRIMKLCLESDDEIASFKKAYLSNFSVICRYCFKIVKQGHFEELSEFIHFTSDDPEVIFDLRVNALKLKCVLEAGPRSFDSFEKYLRETFPDTDQLNEFKKNLILGGKSKSCFKQALRSDYFVENIHLFVEHVLSSMPELLTVAKSRLLEVCRDILISGVLRRVNDDNWDDFIKWCLHGSDEALENFKLLLPVDQIFKAMFEKCVQRVMRSKEESVRAGHVDAKKSFTGHGFMLDFFLRWIFPSREAIQNFKRGKLRALKNSEQMKFIFGSNDRHLMHTCLRWFCNDDKSQMNDFKVSWFSSLSNRRYPEGWRCKLPFLN